ncbi:MULTISPECIES: hypothetical protein [Planktothricoides]|uniref:Uncharacterized protein n=2 Tax=Planktothricoides raciborskii TaxID=132608 RepID=A0AAU8JHF4_9CYAN|nr:MULTISPECIES: hypothetical protein [Planktothricoides]MBD2546222.1 hypothetical protein [Planktothricoides raciborskii FACHB-1370]MBD2584495.1 hypothetical protein [Planktothricoides raciborskii FACHB-1261]
MTGPRVDRENKGRSIRVDNFSVDRENICANALPLQVDRENVCANALLLQVDRTPGNRLPCLKAEVG